MPNLSDRLKALGVKLGARDLPSPRSPIENPYAVERVLSGAFHPTRYGDIFVVENWYSPAHQHGQASLEFRPAPRILVDWAGDTRLATATPAAVAYLDTETTGLAGGAGTYAFLIGVGRYQAGQFQVVQLFMRSPTEEPALLAALTDYLDGVEMMVTFNGKSFDLPLLQTRYTVNRQASPLEPMVQLDLLPLARRLWRNRLPSRALGYLEEHILAAPRGQKDVPGWLIPQIYFDYLRGGDARPMQGVFYHNAMDILAMAALLNHITHLLTDPLDGRVDHPLDMAALGQFFESLAQFDMADRLYRRCLEIDLPEEHYWDVLERLSLMYKRHGNLSAALELWERAADGHQIYAHVELAKYYEHRARDYRQAIHWTEAALTIVQTATCAPGVRRRWRAELEHRLARLRRKMGN